MATHWKSRLIDKAYLGVYSLYDDALETQYIESLTLTIKGFDTDKVFTQSKNAFEQKTGMSFHETDKKLIVNVTNGTRLEQLYGANPDKWIGQRCVLVVETDKRHGKVLRVSNNPKHYAPVQLPEMHPAHPKWNGMVSSIKSGGFSVEQAQSKFTFTPENLTALENAINP